MNIKDNYKKISILLLVLTGLAMFTWAMEFRSKSGNPSRSPAKKRTLILPVYDTAVFNKFDEELHSVIHDHGIKTYGGTITIHDGVDSLNNIEDMPFLIAINGDNSYSRLGTIESIIQDGADIEIEHDQKRVVLTRRGAQMPNLLDNIQKLKDCFRSEYYQLSTVTKGAKRVISFINNTHITCKEFSITYDTLSNHMTDMYTRLTDFDDPLNRKRDKIIDVKISNLNDKADLRMYPDIAKIIRQQNGKATLTSKYEGYQLIIL